MIPSEPESSDTPAPEPERRRRRSAAEATAPTGTTDTPPKPRRKRKTKVEKEAERAARLAADSRIDPKVWMLFGLLLLLAGIAIYIDPIGFEEAGRSDSEPWVKVMLDVLIAFLGKDPTAVVSGILGVLLLSWGFRGWLKARVGSKQK